MKEKNSLLTKEKKPILTKEQEVEILSMQPKTKVKDLTLNDIEQMEVGLILDTDKKNIFFNKQKLEMLDKLATQKLRRLQIEATIQASQPVIEKPQPIKIEFVSANTLDSNARLEKLTKEVEDSLTNNKEA